jgi:hypothetical protein
MIDSSHIALLATAGLGLAIFLAGLVCVLIQRYSDRPQTKEEWLAGRLGRNFGAGGKK